MVKKSLDRCLWHLSKMAAVQTARELGDRDLLERFVTAKDEAAFAILVERYGPLVLGVCCRVLGSTHDAEDACQAAFLVLAQKAGSIRKKTSLASWLHGVAARVAGHVRRGRLRRGRREREVQKPPPADPAAEVSWREVQTILDEELVHLPEFLRAPLILCYLDGHTRDAAAQQLGLSVACLHGRLERGRKTLCQRLIRRGITLSAALMAAAIGQGVSRAALPPTTVLSTARAAAQIGCGRAPAPGLVSAKILRLAQEVSRDMILTKLKPGVWVLLCTGLLTAAFAGALALAPARAGQEGKGPHAGGTPQPAADARRAENEGKQTTVSGSVLDREGKPIAGARIYLLRWLRPGESAQHQAPPKVWTESDKDGRFSFSAAQRDLGELFVTAPGYGPGWVIKPGKLQETWPIEENQVVRLARDDVPVNGRLLDLQGQPIAGVSIRVFSLQASPDGSLDKWIEAIQNRRPGQLFLDHEYLSGCRVDGLAAFFPPVTTDKDGRFQIKGVGRDRVVSFTVEASTIETKAINVLTRPGVGAGDFRLPEGSLVYGDGKTEDLRLKPYYPPTFTHAADPCRVVAGVVRDKATGKPVAGAVVRNDEPVRYPLYYNRTTTDKDGHFRLSGLPLPRRLEANPGIVVLPPGDEPYLAQIKRLPADKEKQEVTLDFDLSRGVWLEGQVKDKATGRGVLAQFRYVTLKEPMRPEEGPQTLPLGSTESSYRDPFNNVTDQDGKFRLVADLDRALLGVSAIGEQSGRYRVGVGVDKIAGLAKPQPGGLLQTPGPLGFITSSSDTLVEIKPEKGATVVRCEVVLDPGRTLTIQVRGPDGKPLDGIRALGQSARDSYPGWSQTLLPAEFAVYALEPGKKRTLLLEHPEKNLAAC
jgi:RNA polymerase sigma factor (sigma-70 family)